ncbi:SDR family NAD(P)-dependent oxidoreductase [Microtetraspora malaysiensis]|uniref:SDR family NAD(P)-dependent oxidoreductase n=1 Tax=Microtetraspora malaysiensis TaxID=161358 RepID=UPI003D92311E
MTNLDGRIALVTGAGQPNGIGQGVVRALLRAGAHGVVFSDIDADSGAASLKLASEEFGTERVAFLQHDVSSEADWQTALDATLDRFGGLDILVNNAGASFAGSLATSTLADLRRGMSVNFESQFIGMQTCMGALAERAGRWAGGAAIVNNSSVGAYLADPSNLTYNVSKAAGRMLAMCAARELGGRNIRVNTVHFGTIDTPLLRASFQRRVNLGQFPDVDTARQLMTANSTLKRLGTPDDAGALVAYLASDEARYITGAAYLCDGGLTTQY